MQVEKGSLDPLISPNLSESWLTGISRRARSSTCPIFLLQHVTSSGHRIYGIPQYVIHICQLVKKWSIVLEFTSEKDSPLACLNKCSLIPFSTRTRLLFWPSNLIAEKINCFALSPRLLTTQFRGNQLMSFSPTGLLAG